VQTSRPLTVRIERSVPIVSNGQTGPAQQIALHNKLTTALVASRLSDQNGFRPVEKCAPRTIQPTGHRVRRAINPNKRRFRWPTSVVGLIQRQVSHGKPLAGSAQKTS
jgi:4'-phosphopantetheinyl transferase EntD